MKTERAVGVQKYGWTGGGGEREGYISYSISVVTCFYLPFKRKYELTCTKESKENTEKDKSDPHQKSTINQQKKKRSPGVGATMKR